MVSGNSAAAGAEGGMDATATLRATEACVAMRRAAELEEMRLAAHWAVLHSTNPGNPAEDPGRVSNRRGQDSLVRLGGEGTPPVRELCLAELGIARQVATGSARAHLACVLDLQHRLPGLWETTQTLAVEGWLARRVATATRALTVEQAAGIDTAVAPVAATLAPSRLLALVEALVIEADPAAEQERREQARAGRFVRLGRVDDQGLRMVVAHLEAGQAAHIDAVIDWVADLLETNPDLQPGGQATGTLEDPSRDELRAMAMGWLARPAELLQLLLTTLHHRQQDHPDADADTEADAEPEPEPESVSEPESDEDPAPAGVPDLVAGLTPDLLQQFLTADLSGLRPAAHLFLHLHQATLDQATLDTHSPDPDCTEHPDAADGVFPGARVEGLGPVLLEDLPALLGGLRIHLAPVLDTAETIAVDAYEFPARVRARVRMRSPGEAFPHSSTLTGTGRQRLDLDHPTPYQPDGPPGQTGDHNAAPLTRGHHRAKTHLGYRVVQLRPGAWLWRTPHGLHRLVDHHGTTPLDDTEARTLLLTHTLDQHHHRLEDTGWTLHHHPIDPDTTHDAA